MALQILSPQGESSSELSYNQFLSLMSDSSLKIRSMSILQGADGIELRGKRDLRPDEKAAVSQRPS